MKKNILVIEDKKEHMDHLCSIIDGLHRDIKIFRAFHEKEAYSIAMEHHIHLFLVDIILKTDKPNDVAGLKFVQEIRSVKKYAFTPVIFTTSLEDPELRSYKELHCFGYIEKPYRDEQVEEIVLKALEFPVKADEDRNVYFRKNGIVYSYRVKDIVYIENSRRLLTIHSVKDDLEITYKTCNDVLKDLDSDRFVQCSRYAIINRDYVEQIDYPNRYVKLRNVEKPVEIGIVMREKFKRRMENDLGNS